jgi:hypothetical protein
MRRLSPKREAGLENRDGERGETHRSGTSRGFYDHRSVYGIHYRLGACRAGTYEGNTASADEHGIAVAEKPVTLPNSFTIGIED